MSQDESAKRAAEAQAILAQKAAKERQVYATEFVRNTGLPLNVLVMGRMLKSGAVPDINVRLNTLCDFTALHYQCKNGTKEAVEWLLTRQEPISVNLQDSDGCTALRHAVCANDPEKVRILLEYGADRFIPNNIGEFPLVWAKKQVINPTIIALLQTYSPDISFAARQERADRFNGVIATINNDDDDDDDEEEGEEEGEDLKRVKDDASTTKQSTNSK